MKTTKKSPVWRENEFPPDSRSTDAIYKFLRQVGGTTPYGENKYLLAVGSKVRKLFGHAFEDYDEGSDGARLVFDEERVVKKVETRLPGTKHVESVLVEMPAGMHVSGKPARIVKEMRWVERFPNLEGWVLLHWEPQAGGCTRDWWENWKVPGTELHALGPWPEKGMYWTFCEGFSFTEKLMTYSYFDNVPPLSWMERAIATFENHRSTPDKIADRDFRMLAALSEWRDFKLKQAQKQREETKARFAESMKPIFSSSLEAGRIREQWAQRIKERTGQDIGHVGA